MKSENVMREALAIGLVMFAVGARAAEPAITTNQVVAYYFHGTIRCETCLRIERQAGEVVTNLFGAEVALGHLRFKALNYDQPENAHYLKDYKLPCPSLVLVRQKEGKDQDWKLLGQTWEMVQIPPKLDLYIEEELRQFLSGTNSPATGGAGTNGAVVPGGPGTNNIVK